MQLPIYFNVGFLAWTRPPILSPIIRGNTTFLEVASSYALLLGDSGTASFTNCAITHAHVKVADEMYQRVSARLNFLPQAN